MLTLGSLQARRTRGVVWIAAGLIGAAFGAGVAYGQITGGAEYPTNESGDTYGSYSEQIQTDEDWPDLIAVVTDEGEEGYVYRSDFLGGEAASPEEALAGQRIRPRSITAYASDGETVVGAFSFGPILDDPPGEEEHSEESARE